MKIMTLLLRGEQIYLVSTFRILQKTRKSSKIKTRIKMDAACSPQVTKMIDFPS